jgi:hypothetical protein
MKPTKSWLRAVRGASSSGRIIPDSPRGYGRPRGGRAAAVLRCSSHGAEPIQGRAFTAVAQQRRCRQARCGWWKAGRSCRSRQHDQRGLGASRRLVIVRPCHRRMPGVGVVVRRAPRVPTQNRNRSHLWLMSARHDGTCTISLLPRLASPRRGIRFPGRAACLPRK